MANKRGNGASGLPFKGNPIFRDDEAYSFSSETIFAYAVKYGAKVDMRVELRLDPEWNRRQPGLVPFNQKKGVTRVDSLNELLAEGRRLVAAIPQRPGQIPETQAYDMLVKWMEDRREIRTSWLCAEARLPKDIATDLRVLMGFSGSHAMEGPDPHLFARAGSFLSADQTRVIGNRADALAMAMTLATVNGGLATMVTAGPMEQGRTQLNQCFHLVHYCWNPTGRGGQYLPADLDAHNRRFRGATHVAHYLNGFCSQVQNYPEPTE